MKKIIQVPALLFFSAFLFVSSSPFNIYGEEGTDMETKAVMLALSRAITELQKTLTLGDAVAVLSHAKALKEATGKLSDLRAQRNIDLAQLFNEYQTTIGNLSAEMVSLAEEKNLEAATHVLEDIRDTCISCHAKFRINTDETGFFPARKNTIAGQAKILKLNGEERFNRSNVVVFLDHVSSPTGFPSLQTHPAISQKNQRFTPRALPVMKGTTVDFPNDDDIFHNVFSLSKIQPFDLGTYPPGASRSVRFSKTGWAKVYCNLHPHMVSHIIVLDNPFFALTDRDGFFVISGVPDGEYTLRAWHEFGREVRTKINISDASLQTYALEIQENRKFVQHRNKFGKSYKEKYK